MAIETDVQIYTIITDSASANTTIPFRPSLIKKPIDRGEEHRGRGLLEDLSNKTGGLHLRVQNGVEAEEAAEKVGRAIRNQYVIGYQPQGLKVSGKWRRVRVKSDVPGTKVYARNGYYGQ